MALAKLTVDLEMRTATFEQGAAVARRQVEGLATNFAKASGALAGFAAIASSAVVGAGVYADKVIRDIANIKGLAEQAGLSAESLAAMQTVAATSGVSLERISQISATLSTRLAKTSDESKAAAVALKAIGIPLEQIRSLKPEDQLKLVADRLSGYAEGGGRAAVATVLLGEAGAKALPLFNDLAEAGKLQIRLTQEQIEAADNYAKASDRSRSELEQFVQVAAAQALPAIAAFTGAIRDTAAEIVGLSTESTKLGQNTGVADFATSAAKGLAFVVDAGDGVGRVFEYLGQTIAGYAAVSGELLSGNLSTARKLGAEIGQELDDILQRKLFSDRLAERFAAQSGSTTAEAVKPALSFRLPDTKGVAAAAREAEQVRRAQLAQDLQFTSDQFATQRQVTQFNLQELQSLYGANNISLQDYFDRRRQVISSGVQDELNALTDRQARLEVELAGAGDPSKREELQTKINETVSSGARVRREAAQAVKLATIEEADAYDKLSERVQSFRANLAQLAGDEKEAARLRAATAIADARRQQVQSGGLISDADIDRFERLTKQALEYADVQRRIGIVTQQTATQEEAYLLRATQAGASLQETDRGVYLIRSVQLSQLGELRDKLQQMADASKGRDEALVASAQAVALEYARAAESIDPAINRMREQGKELASALAEDISSVVVRFTSLQDFGKSILNTLQNTAQKIIQAPIEQALQGYTRKAIDSLMGTSTDTSSAAATTAQTAAITANTSIVNSASGSLIVMGSAADVAAQALLKMSVMAGASGGGSTGSDIAGLISSMNGGGSVSYLADGTNYVPYDGFKAILHKGEEVTPAKYNPAAGGQRAGGGQPIINVHPAPNTEVQEARQNDDGSIDVFMKSTERYIANRFGRGQSPLNQAAKVRGLNTSAGLAKRG